jgi:ABC-type multidrug transport system ATPase subunit
MTTRYIPVLGESVTETITGGDMGSGHAVTAGAGVVAAGAGVRYGNVPAVRLASFRLTSTELGCGALGIVTHRPGACATLIDLLSGRVSPSFGELRVLGHDMRTPRGRSLVRRQTGVASRHATHPMNPRIRTLVEHAARPFIKAGSERRLLVAAIIDRLNLEPWAEVPLHAAPELVARKARLAAACVHQPKLLLVDGLLDHLHGRNLAVLTDIVKDLERDAAVIAFGADAEPLMLTCQRVLTLAGGIVTDVAAPHTLPVLH